MSNQSRFRVVSKDGKTDVIDLTTGESIGNLVRKVEFLHDAEYGNPMLVLTLIDWNPEVTAEQHSRGAIDVTSVADQVRRFLGIPKPS
jgi:hypothetical protein